MHPGASKKSMREINIEELRELQLGILDVVAEFCEKEHINYWLDCGTLLGAIRHKGYIPWDDDIDIGMLRPDYERFLKQFNGFNERYQVCAYECDTAFLYPFAKILDTNTILYEPDENGNKLSVNIDLFVYDNAPEDPEQVKKMYAQRGRMQILHIVRNSLASDKGSKVRRFLMDAGKIALSVFPKDYFIRGMVNNSKKYASENTTRVGNFTSVSKIVCDKTVFDSFILTDFESRRYRIPERYDSWLKLFYGNYMQLPPKEKQVSHHAFVAYVKD